MGDSIKSKVLGEEGVGFGREAEKNGLTFVHHKEKNRWAAVKFTY